MEELGHESRIFCTLRKESAELCYQQHGVDASSQSMGQLSSVVLIALALGRSKALHIPPMASHGTATTVQAEKMAMAVTLFFTTQALLHRGIDADHYYSTVNSD
ncbi:unnamed protein product [Hydatigera taeniaeformis]|uniref:Uncharacterized protein n=1 Tax=Hydatigena taeniaeformis TaxID=6205 RepID=A0A0R3WZD1_HYDTA|nr:unnamed protein product [Hydatigera taeniaeformis]